MGTMYQGAPDDPFELNFRDLLGIEGGEVDDPDDSGGHTRWGITERIARAWGYEGPMSALPLTTARVIYRGHFWDVMRCSDVHATSPALAGELFEQGVNMGCSRAVSHLQRWLNALNDRGSLWGDMQADGLMGAITLAALRSFHQRRGVEGLEVLYTAMNSLQAAWYLELAERREKDEKFLWGWLRARVARSRAPRA